MKKIKLKKFYVLPEPPKTGPEEWESIPKLARVIPYGYKKDPDRVGWLLPIPLELEAMKKAKKYIKQYSYRQVANWLTTTTGRPISFNGLRCRLDLESKRERSKTITEKVVKEYKRALEELEKLENQRLGATRKEDTSGGQTA